ncbi:MAG: sugar phosphate isomerase/epimerase [Candidatus Omnitrophica bacterium]|nr:sugar phosphate isomerase/epimerase [Candidatus Omnitrophota bacterium]
MIGISINVKLINGSLVALKNALDRVKQVGFDVVELPLHGLDVIVGGKIRNKRLKEIKNILKSYPFNYCVHCPESLDLMNLKEIETEKAILKSSIEFLYEIGAHILVYHPGRYKSEIEILLRKQKRLNQRESERLKKIERDILKDFSSTLKEANVVLCMENARPFISEKDYTYAEDIEGLVKQVKKIDDENIRIALDFGHAYLSTNFYNKDFLTTISKVKPYLKHLHLHDNFGYPSYFQEKDQNLLIVNGRGDMHMPPGWGKIPFKKAIQLLSPAGCFFIIEPRPRYFEYIKESKEMLKTLIKS